MPAAPCSSWRSRGHLAAPVSVLPLQEQGEHPGHFSELPGHFSELTGSWELEEGKGLTFLIFLRITHSVPSQQSVLLE